jgi:hypothetical protein
VLGRGVIAAVLVALAFAAGPAAASQYPDVPWPELLPPFPVASDHQPPRIERCRHGRIACVDRTIRRMKRLQTRLGCDHRGVFATTYLTLSHELRPNIAKGFFEDRRYLSLQVTEFANFYFRTLHRYERGQPVPEAWQIAMDTATKGDVNAAQDMLLGINAHVQRDMPFVVAEMGLVTRKGESRKADHDRGNVVLNAAYQKVIDAVRDRYDPALAITNANGSPADDALGMEMVKGWREGVWRNAERLVNAKSKADYKQVSDSIEANAANWARMIASVPQPGYRAQRDAYCQAKLAGG